MVFLYVGRSAKNLPDIRLIQKLKNNAPHFVQLQAHMKKPIGIG